MAESERIRRFIVTFLASLVGTLAGTYVKMVVFEHGTFAPPWPTLILTSAIVGVLVVLFAPDLKRGGSDS